MDENNVIDKSTKRDIYEILFGKFGTVHVDYENKVMIIKGINYSKFLLRIKHMYLSRGLITLFAKKYSWWSQMMWQKKKITADQRKITQLEVPLFFALEIHNIFYQLAEFYNLKYYKTVADKIYKHTWISNFEHKDMSELKTTPIEYLSNLKYEPKDYQKEFILNYKKLKYIYDLEGYILSFDQGLGKTFTAIALSEVLDKDRIIIVCPNSLKENWAYEIRMYYKKYTNDDIWKSEVYVYGNSKFNRFSKTTKYIIVNQEAIDKIIPLVKSEKDYMIVVDESHNFRNLNAARTTQLLKLKNITKCKDNLIMSGTPIKAIPNEIVPALLMIDPYFTMELATLYTKAFNIDKPSVSAVVKARFDRTMYRKTKQQVLELPEKYIEDMEVEISDPKEFYMINLNKTISELFDKYYSEKLKENSKLATAYVSLVNKHSSADTSLTRSYIKYILKVTNTPDSVELHDYDKFVYSTFLKDYVYPNITDKKERDKLRYLESQYIYMKNSAIGLALGEVIPKARSSCYIRIYDENCKKFINMINENTKKTIIFTPFVDVCDHIYEDLRRKEIGVIKINGKTEDRMTEIQKFKNDDTIDVLVATTQTLSTGVTLTEATLMLFFGVPWRSADYNQATDRIHRIGQTQDVYIYNIFLRSNERNITNNMQDILKWSEDMFNNLIN